MNCDRELLRRYYLQNGYGDFEVLSAVAELAPNRENFYMTFTIKEGSRTHKVHKDDTLTVETGNRTAIMTMVGQTNRPILSVWMDPGTGVHVTTWNGITGAQSLIRVVRTV